MYISRIGNVEAVLFDMDGLMFNSEDIYRAALEKMGDERGRQFTDVTHRQMMGRSSFDAIRVLKKAWDLQEDELKLIEERDQKVIAIAPTVLKIMPGVQAILDFCIEKQVKHAIVTGSRKEVADVFLNASGLRNGFSFILDGESVEHGKPEPDIYLKACEIIGEDPGDCLVFEDSLNGVKSASSAGCKVIACPNGYNQEEDFSIADIKVDSLTQIVSVLSFIG